MGRKKRSQPHSSGQSGVEAHVVHATTSVQPIQTGQDAGHGGLLGGLMWHLLNKPPLAVFLLISILFLGLVLLFQVLAQKHFYPIFKIQLGFDYGVFYRASEAILAGGNPYDAAYQKHNPYPTPPIPAIVNIPFTYISHSLASVFISLLTFVSVMASVFLMHGVFTPPHEKSRVRDKAMLLLIMLILMFSHPFQFLFDRGNIDGFVLLLTSLGVYFLMNGKSTPRRGILAGVFFAVAVSFKVYPVLVVLPLVAMRRWRVLASLSVAFLCLILVAPGLWVDWFEWTTSVRTELFKSGANSSLANTLFHFGELFGSGMWLKEAALPLWGTSLLAMFCFDYVKMPKAAKRKETFLAGLLFYVPFMVAVPQLAYRYELVCVLVLLPVVSYLWAGAARKERKVLLLVTVGLAMTSFQAFPVEQLLSTMSLPWWVTGSCAERLQGVCLPQWIPGIGLFVVMTGCVIYKLRYLYKPMPGSQKQGASAV